jgi:hypothetical protein
MTIIGLKYTFVTQCYLHFRLNIPCNNERSVLVHSTFNFTVPYLSTLAILILIAGAVVLYLVSVRYLLMAWGVNKFARKLIRPHSVPNNEILDLLSRVPDDEDLVCTTLSDCFSRCWQFWKRNWRSLVWLKCYKNNFVHPSLFIRCAIIYCVYFKFSTVSLPKTNNKI